MSRDTQPLPPSSVSRPRALRALAGVEALMGLLILAQAALAGQFLKVTNTTAHLQDIHGYIGSVVFLLAIVQVVLVLASGIAGRLRAALLGQTILLLILVFIQVGLGYGGRDRNNIASALHIPNGVLIFGLTMTNISFAMRALRETWGSTGMEE